MCVCVSAAILAQFCEIKRFTSFTFSVLHHVKSHESHEDHQEGCSASTGNEGHESDEGPHVFILARTFLKRRWPDLPGSKLMTKSSFEPLREKCLISKLKFKTWVRATFAFLLTRRGAARPTPPRPIARQPSPTRGSGRGTGTTPGCAKGPAGHGRAGPSPRPRPRPRSRPRPRPSPRRKRNYVLQFRAGSTHGRKSV